MFRFGIYADRDGFFIGGRPPKWVGVHVDLPWSADCKQYGAPYRIYLHWWPGKCKSISLRRLLGTPIDPFITAWGDPSTWVQSSHRRRSCSVEGCDGEGDEEEDVTAYMVLNKSLRYRGGAEVKLGSLHAGICPRHARMAEDEDGDGGGYLSVRLEEFRSPGGS